MKILKRQYKLSSSIYSYQFKKRLFEKSQLRVQKGLEINLLEHKNKYSNQKELKYVENNIYSMVNIEYFMQFQILCYLFQVQYEYLIQQYTAIFAQETTFIPFQTIQSYDFDFDITKTETESITNFKNKFLGIFLKSIQVFIFGLILIGDFNDIGIQGWVKFTSNPPSNMNTQQIIQSSDIIMGDEILPAMTISAIYNPNTNLTLSCDVNTNDGVKTVQKTIKFSKWFFFVCSFDLIMQSDQTQALQLLLYSVDSQPENSRYSCIYYKVYDNFKGVKMPDSWTFTYTIQNELYNWVGSLRDFNIVTNVKFNELNQKQLSLAFGQYTMKYFFQLDSREGNLIYDSSQGYSYILQKFPEITPPSYDPDGMGINFSQPNQSFQIDYIELNKSFMISFWFKPIIQSTDSLDKQRILTFMQYDSDTTNRFQIYIKQDDLQLSYFDGEEKIISFGAVKQKEWNFLFLSIYKINEFMVTNSYLSADFSISNKITFIETSKFFIKYDSILYKLNVGGLITLTNGVNKAEDSFNGEIKDLQISHGGSIYHEQNRNTNQNCGILAGFTSKSIRCLLCKKDYFLNDKINSIQNNCTKNICPAGYYKQNKVRQCEACYSKCKTCIGGNSNQCNSCNTDFYKLKTQCFQICPTGYFNSPTSFDCFECDQKCYTCNGKKSSDCIECKPGFYKSQDACEDCHKYCSECYGQKSSECTKCTSTTYLYGNSCLINCPDGYYQNKLEQSCSKCDSSCLTCENSPKNCLTCPASTYLKLASIQTCESCHPFCLECFGSEQSNCITCSSDYFQDGNNCVEICPDNKYRNMNGDYKSCEICIDPCLTCYTKEKCRSCISGYYFNESTSSCIPCNSKIENCQKCSIVSNQLTCSECSQNYLDGNICTPVCSNRNYPNSLLKKCDACNISCTKCYGPKSSDCTECDKGYYLDSNESTCKSCPDNCTKCGQEVIDVNLTITQCLQCTTDSYLVQVEKDQQLYIICQQKCPYGTFENSGTYIEIKLKSNDTGNVSLTDFKNSSFENSQTNYKYCKQCRKNGLQNCQDCDSSGALCETCDLTFYVDNMNQCSQCSDFGCEQCYYVKANDPSQTSQGKCTSCTTGKFLFNEKCIDAQTCSGDKTHFTDTEQNVCAKCNPICKTCSGGQENNCLSCEDGYFQKTLVDKSVTCQKCPFSCEKCTSLEFCNSCISNYFLDVLINQCVLSCPDSYYGSNKICQKCQPTDCKQCNNNNQCLICNSHFFKNQSACNKCDDSCLECQGAPSDTNNNCTKCYPEKKLYQQNCIDKCPIYTYEDPNGICLNCDPSCELCTDKLNTSCSKCRDGFYFEDPFSCIICDTSCLSCTGPGLSNCLACAKGYYKLGNATCIKACIDGYYPDSQSWECKPCSEDCGKCTALNNCLQCKQGYYQVSKDRVNCLSCDKSCKECSDSDKNCSSCNYGYYLDSKTCYDKCPKGKGREIDNLCVLCKDPNCAICNPTQKDICTVCIDGYKYDPTTSACVKNCPDGYFAFQQYDKSKIPSDASQYVCSKCDSACKTCFGSLPSQCNSCISSYFYHPETHECALVCQYGYIIDSNTQNQCKICQTLCLSCIKTQFQYQSTCYTDGCPFGTELISQTNICQPKLIPSVKIKSDGDNIQVSSDIIIQADVNSQIQITKQQWKLLNPVEEEKYLFKGVETQFSTLIIPVQNIKIDKKYELQITVENKNGVAKDVFKFDASKLIKVGKYDITTESGFISGNSVLQLDLRGWQVSSIDIKFDVYMYIENKKVHQQNNKNYTTQEFTKMKSIGSDLLQNQEYKFKTMPLIQDTEMTFAIRGFTSQKSVTVYKKLLMSANQDYRKILIDQEKNAQNLTSEKYFGADDNFYLNFFGSNLPSEIEDIVIQMEIAKQLLKNYTFVQDASFHQKNQFFQLLQIYNTSVIECEDKVDCSGKGRCSISYITYYWTPLDPNNPTDTTKLSESYKKPLRKCTCDPLYGGAICNWESTYYQNITSKIKEAVVYIQQMPQNKLNPANTLNLYATISEYKDVISENFLTIYANSIKFLKMISGQPIYFNFMNEIIINYIDILINYVSNFDQSEIQKEVQDLYNLQQNYLKNIIPYLYESDGVLLYQNNVYQLILAQINQEQLQDLAYTTSNRRVLEDIDLFEFGDGSDILISMYSIPSISINALKTQVLIPYQILKNPGKLVIKIQSFQINPFDYMINCTLISQNQVSSFGMVEIFNSEKQLSTISMSVPITIVLKKIIRSKSPKIANITASAYSCMNYMDTYKNWNSTHCSVQTQNSTHIACACYSLEGPVVVVALSNQLLTPISRQDVILLNQFINPSLQQERLQILQNLGLWKPPNDNTSSGNNTSTLENPTYFQIKNYFGIYSFLCYCFGLSIIVFQLSSSKTKKDSESININPINRPYMHFHPLYSFLFGPTNIFITNNQRAFIILATISSNMFYPSFLVYTPSIRNKFSIIHISLISCAASVGTSYILFGFPTFIKLGLSSIASKKVKGKKAAFIGFSYSYLIQILALIFILDIKLLYNIVTQYFILSTVGLYDNEDHVIIWVKCIGYSYMFENIVDIIYVIYVLQRGILDKVSQLIALRGYVLLPEELLIAGSQNVDEDIDEIIFEDGNRIKPRIRKNPDEEIVENMSSLQGSDDSIEQEDDNQKQLDEQQRNQQEEADFVVSEEEEDFDEQEDKYVKKNFNNQKDIESQVKQTEGQGQFDNNNDQNNQEDDQNNQEDNEKK